MIHMMAKYKLREGREAAVKAAAEEFVGAIRLHTLDMSDFAVYCEKDSLTFYHIMNFKDEGAAVKHKDAVHTEKFWETVMPHCEEIQQLSEHLLIASLKWGQTDLST